MREVIIVQTFFLWQKIDKSAKLACVHDSARPLVLVKDIEMVSVQFIQPTSITVSLFRLSVIFLNIFTRTQHQEEASIVEC